jgi:hypothetical protein
VKTYSHVGRLGIRQYESFESYWHGDGPRPRPSHACNEAGPGRYRSLCGKAIVPGDGGDMLPDGDVTKVVPAGEVRVTCRRCRKLLG